ncbi:DUF3048 domain-containing protein [Crossiella sp. CA-258035]|uniref:DUF3048 domain-containing protein n=1 Tax=Crossiella sp. CA-258035 TaxID=2981138 RepID=UPI0024BCEEA3|nr:DUF3048 domain-containing protein [Crossiella sp. CA-258035]WHT16711.1 DUF3048 domain-containing protein [Crossiella sp. CA-258035]
MHRLTAPLLSLLLLGACSTPAPPPTSPSSSAAEAPSPLTGLPAAAGQPVLAVKIDNVSPARPQTGLTQADLLYLEPVEGGLTRFVAVFSSRLPASVGPVRSARESDLELLQQFQRPALAYSGSAPELAPRIAAAPLVPVPPDKARDAYTHDSRRAAPHNTYAVPEKLLAAAPGAGAVRDIGFRFGPAPEGGAETTQHVVRYPAAVVSLDYSPQEQRWRVGMDGAPLAAAEGGAVSVSTVVVQKVVVRDSPFRDSKGTSPFAQTVGSGEATVLRDGRSYQGRWSRPAADNGTTFTQPGGQPLTFATGPLLVLLVPA